VDYRVLVAVDGDAVTVRTDMARMAPELRAVALDALARHLEVDLHVHEPMRKADATGPERPDPRYSELATLIEHARSDWAAWGQLLTRKVLDLLDAGKLLPLNRQNETVLRRLFEDHREALLVQINGRADLDARRMSQLQTAGLVSPDIAQRGGYVALAYRLGKGLDTLKQHELPVPDRQATLAEALRVAVAPKLTPEDEAAIEWVQKRAGELITRPVQTAAGRVLVRLSDDDLGSIRATLAGHLEEGTDRGKLKQDLAAALTGTTLQNDLDRIIRTELQFAHGYGAYNKLKEQAKTEFGEDDPQVYRVASINACTHCKRIWGPPTKPIIYRLSQIEAHEAQGGNVGLPAAQWGPVIGPVHPNCACSPLAYYRPVFQDAISRVAEEVLKNFGRF
jgi:hypothetical protein